MTAPQPRDPAAGKSIASAELRRHIERLRQVVIGAGFEPRSAVGHMKFERNVLDRKVVLTAGSRSRNRYLHPDISRRVHTGMVLSLKVETSVQTRLLFSPAASRARWLIGFLQRRAGNTDLGDLGGAYPGSWIWASEPAWARRFLVRDEAHRQVTNLLGSGDTPPGALAWGPQTDIGACSFTPAFVPPDLTEEALQEWVGALVALATAAEEDPPEVTALPSWWGRQAEQGNLPMIIALLLLGIPMLLMGLVVLLALALILLVALFD